MRVVVRPNFDTLYSSGWLDLTKEPMVVSVPDTGGRYYLLPMLDMWTDVFASPGWRTTGTGARQLPRGAARLAADLREQFAEEFRLPDNTQRIDAPTPYVWIIGRTKTDGPADYDAVHKIQAGYKITPLSQWGKEPVRAGGRRSIPAIDMKTPPKIQVDTMPAAKFFAYAAELLKLQPPHITDQPIIARMERIGIEPGKSFDIDKADPAVQKALASAPEDAQKLMAWKVPTLARVVNGWSMNTDTMGVYGNYYLKRAIVAQLGLGANLPEDAIYPLNLADDDRQAARRRQATTPSTSTRARRRRSTPSGRSRSTTATASRWRTRSTASPSAAGCRSSTTPTARSTSTSRTRAPARTRKRTGCRRRRGRST